MASMTDLNLALFGSVRAYAHCSLFCTYALKKLSALTSLTESGLGECKDFTDKGLEILRSLPSLTELDLSYCSKITKQGLHEIKTAWPNCKIGEIKPWRGYKN